MSGISAQYVDGLEFRVKELGEQVEKLKAELKSIDGALNDPRANLTLTTSEIIWELKGQVERLTKERDIKEHCITQFELEDLRMKEQLAALAEQNEKLREALQAMVDEAFVRNCGLKIADEALSLPDLASPVLNRIRAEAMEEAAKIANEHEGVAWAVSAIRNRKAELEKSNG